MLTGALALVAVGLLAGLLGALLGLGGGIFLVPALTVAFGLPMRVAVGTSLVCVIATSAGVAAVTRPGRGPDWSLALRLQAATIAGAIAGGRAAGWLPAPTLSLLFGAVALATAAFIGLRRPAGPPDSPERLFCTDYQPRRWATGLAASSLAGLLSGMLGVGGGFLQVPLMYAVMEVPLGVATATSNFMVGLTAAASVLVYLGRGDIHALVVVPTAVGIFAGATTGAYLLPRARAHWLRGLLVGVLVLISLRMFALGAGR